MIFQIFESGLSFGQNLILLLIMLCVVLGSIMIHELAHGYVSMLLGDPTAKKASRLTLNPLKHLDPVGTALMIFCGFGWAKPVPVNPRYYKNPKRGMAITALAGPLMNLLIGVSATVILTVTVWLWESGVYTDLFIIRKLTPFSYDIITTALYIILYYNLLLAVFNMFPVPPLDGSRIVFAVLPDRYYFSVMRYEKLIMVIMFFILWTGFLTGIFEFLVDLIIRGVGTAVLLALELLVKLFI